MKAIQLLSLLALISFAACDKQEITFKSVPPTAAEQRRAEEKMLHPETTVLHNTLPIPYVDDVTVGSGLTPESWAGKYEVVKNLTTDASDNVGKYLVITLQSLKFPDAPYLSFIDQTGDTTAAVLHKAAVVDVIARTDGVKGFETKYYAADGSMLYKSMLTGF
jgi:hypothetical protein